MSVAEKCGRSTRLAPPPLQEARHSKAKGEQTQAAGCRGFASRAPEWYELANENCHITNIDGDLRIRILDAALEK